MFRLAHLNYRVAQAIEKPVEKFASWVKIEQPNIYIAQRRNPHSSCTIC